MGMEIHAASNPARLDSLGQFVRARRRELGITQTELARRLGWSQERISTLENGKYGMPSVPGLSRLASALDASLVDLLQTSGFSDHAMSPVVAAGKELHGGSVLLYTLQRLLALDARTLKEALEQVADMVADVMSADKVDAMIYEAETNSLVALGASNTPMGHRQHEMGMNRLPIVNGGREVEVYETGRPYQSGEAQADPGMLPGMTVGLGIQSVIAVPFNVDGVRRGVLITESSTPDCFAEEDLPFLETVASWAGMVAHRAELTERVTMEATDSARRVAEEELMTILAHDLGNHLTPLKGHLEILRRKAAVGDRQDFLAELCLTQRSVGRIEQLVRDMLDMSRLEHGAFSVSKREVDLVALVREVADRFAGDEIRIDVRAPETLQAIVDPSRICQVLENLVTNSVQHSLETGTILITLKREIRLEGEWAMIEVRDDGPGIPTDLLPTLFQRFARGGAASGLGLGLYLARGITEAHGGRLTVDSVLGHGSTFCIELPTY